MSIKDLKFKEGTLPIGEVVFDENLQIRVALSDARIKEFVEIFDQLPSVKVVKEENVYHLADGFHRYKAAQKLGEKNLSCLIADGVYRDALEIAVVENARGALNLSREDKRNAIEKMLLFFPERANSWIASDVGVAMQTVESVREDLENRSTIPHYDEFLRRDEKPTPRVYQKLAPTVVPKVEETASILSNLDDNEKRDLMRLSTKALGRKYEDATVTADKPAITRDTLQAIQKSLGKVEHVRTAERDTGGLVFVGDDKDVFAEAIDVDRNRGIRAKFEKNMVHIRIYEIMKDPSKLFPKAVLQLDVSTFGSFLSSCGKYWTDHLGKT